MRKLILVITVLALPACAKKPPQAAAAAQRSGPPPAAVKALAPDASHEEIQAALAQVTPNPADRSGVLAEMEVASKRIFAWQAILNTDRPPERRLRFDRNMKGFPIDAPFEYNGETVVAEFHAAVDALNPEMKAVVADPTAPLPNAITTPDDEFESRGKKVLSAYDHAMRWEALSPYLDYYRTRDVGDIRGYWGLHKVDQLEEKLAHWKDVPPEDARRLANWLLGVCRNGRTELADCMKELGPLEAAGDVSPFWKAHGEDGRRLLDWYFSLVEARTDVAWLRDAGVEGPQVPFTKPAHAQTADLAKGLIEAAWKGTGWQLRLGFTERADEDTPHLVFQAGALPHVNRIAGSEITMDENVPADNEVSSSVFQHEFGHVIGFPDCYVELYDEAAQKMVNYQIDVDNIMCSRAGKVSDLHRDANAAAYGAQSAAAVPRGPASRKKPARPVTR